MLLKVIWLYTYFCLIKYQDIGIERVNPPFLLRLLSFFPRGDESDYSEDDLNMNRSDESGSSASRVEPEPVMTIYQEDSLVEQFGSSTDQTEEFSDENKSIVWFLVKQVSIYL